MKPRRSPSLSEKWALQIGVRRPEAPRKRLRPPAYWSSRTARYCVAVHRSERKPAHVDAALFQSVPVELSMWATHTPLMSSPSGQPEKASEPPMEPPTQRPMASITVRPPTDTLAGWMSPVTSPAIRAYGTLATSSRGVISGSIPTVTPRNLGRPLNSVLGNMDMLPSATEKYPSSKVSECVSLHSAMPPVGAS
jgi:hypothetical protein